VFDTKFNYSFGYQQSDNCEKCDSPKLKLEKETDDDKNGVLQVEKKFTSQ